MLDWGTCPREAGPPGPRLSSPGKRERNAVMSNRVGVNMLQFYSVSHSLSHTTLSIKWDVYFSKRLCHSSLLCRCYDSACICRCICIMCLYSCSWPWLYNKRSSPWENKFCIWKYKEPLEKKRGSALLYRKKSKLVEIIIFMSAIS